MVEKTNFLHLPRELRDKIYRYVLVSHTCRIFMSYERSFKSRYDRDIIFLDDSGVPEIPKVTLNLLRTCRQIHAETRNIPYQQNIYSGTRSTPMGTLATDMKIHIETRSMPRLQRLELFYLEDHAMGRIGRSMQDLMCILSYLACNGAFQELTLMDSFFRRIIKPTLSFIIPTSAFHPIKSGMLVDLQQPSGAFKTNLKLLRSTIDYPVSESRQAIYDIFAADSETCQSEVMAILKAIHFSYGCDLLFEEYLLWRDCQQVEDFNLTMF